TVSDFGTATPRIGDRYRIGEVLLEVTAPRIPCSVFAAKMGDPAFAKTFAKARRPGLYVRVLETGMLRAGMAMELIPAAPENPEVLELFDFWLGKERDPEMAKRFLASPVAER
ncbi:MAG: MOSC domain-containing protein, partial [Calditrichaeota bacterium]|nr:MOSC domain-containing protein [Calditrichota bacterium]